jgi:MFS family permease
MTHRDKVRTSVRQQPIARTHAPPLALAMPPFVSSPTPQHEADDLHEPLLPSSRGPEPSASVRGAMSAWKMGPQGVIVLLCCINLLNYMDRGIVSGAPEKFNAFISSTLGVSVLRQSVYFGLLTSAFIIGHSILSVVFGQFALSHRPFRIIAVGMSIWMLAVVVCGVAKAVDSYYVLIIGRVISGVGEASFQCVAPPFIDRYAPAEHRSFYVGIYLASIAVGMALGFVYGSLFANSVFTWAGAFYFEAILMAPLVLACLFCVPAELNQVPKDDAEPLHQPLARPSELDNDVVSKRSLDGSIAGAIPLVGAEKQQSSHRVWWEILSNVPFLLVILGHAGYTFSLAALSAFSPSIMIGLGLFDSETTVSLFFGGIVAVAGILGTPIGGIIVDKLSKRNGDDSSDRRCVLAVSSLLCYVVGAVVLGLALIALTGHKAGFIIVLTVFLFCMCALTVPEMIAVLELFPESRRPMAISVNAIVIHALGDVPSPIILGALKDAWAPHCGTVEIDGEAHLNPDCSKDQAGLRDVLLFAILWLVWGVIMWGVALVVVKKRHQQHLQQTQVLSSGYTRRESESNEPIAIL